MAKRFAEQGLYRTHDACLGGVCSGIARRFDLDTIVVRLMAIGITAITLGIAGIVYAVLWATLPLESMREPPCEVKPEQAESSAYGFMDLANPSLGARCDAAGDGGFSFAVRVAVAVCLIVLFLTVALNVSPMISGSQWWQFWPIGLVIAGLCLIVVPMTESYGAQWHAAGIVLASLAISFIPMSLGVVSWYTFTLAFQSMWVLIALAVVLFAAGTFKHIGALVIMGSLLVSVFCILMLMNYTVPGDVTHLLIHMPDGRSMRIAITSVFALA